MAQYSLPFGGWVAESGLKQFALPFVGWLSESNTGASTVGAAIDAGTISVSASIAATATAAPVQGSITASVAGPSAAMTGDGAQTKTADISATINHVVAVAALSGGLTAGISYQRALPFEGWISEGAPGAFALPFSGWIHETGTASLIVTGALSGKPAAPSAAMAAYVTPVSYGGSLIRATALPFDGWLVETRAGSYSLPFGGWVYEAPVYQGEAGDITAVPTPTVAIVAGALAVGSIDAHGVPVLLVDGVGDTMTPTVRMAGTVLAWECAEIFDDVPAPAAAVHAQALQPTALADITAAVAGPQAAVTGLIVAQTPFADILGAVPAPVSAMAADVFATADVAAVITIVAAVTGQQAYVVGAAIDAQVPAPQSFANGVLWTSDVFDEPDAFYTIAQRPVPPVIEINPPRPPPAG